MLARPVGYRCAAAEVSSAIERLLRIYLQQRNSAEDLRQFFGRHRDDELRSFLAGDNCESEPRDLASDGVRQSAET